MDRNGNGQEAPLVLFGAFDRHNLGDMLFAHVAAAEAGGRELIFAGLASRDLRPWGGHRVEAVARVAAQWPGPCDVLHVGGELLTCDAFEAAVMLLEPEEATAAIAAHDGKPDRIAWGQKQLGLRQRAPYVLPRSLFARPGKVVFNAVGGVDLERRDAALRREVIEHLRAADAVSVRDQVTHAVLARAGLHVPLVPDPVERAAVLFRDRIRARRDGAELTALRQRFAGGYRALQFAAAISDDATLARLAGALARAGSQPVVLFRAGAAPWHDQLEPYRRLVARLPMPAAIFQSLDIWDICALIAGASEVWASSLHAVIVARAFGVPYAPLPLEPDHPVLAKLRIYLDTWDGLP